MFKYLKPIVSLVLGIALCLGVGVGIGMGIIWWRSPAKRGFEKSEGPLLITGVGDAPSHHGFTLRATDLGRIDAILQQGQSLFATTIGIEYDATLTRDALSQAVAAAHQRNMAVVLLPPPAFATQNPYPRPLIDIAADAQAANVDDLCISWLAVKPDMSYWQEQSQQLRHAFPGRLILAATPEILPQIENWDAADIIGAIGPLTLARRLPDVKEEATLHDMRVAWSCSLGELESLASVNGKKLALLHMNVPLTISSRLPSDARSAATPPNPALQQLAYEALLVETKGRAERTDILLFSWHPTNSAGAGRDAPSNLPALLPRVADAWDPKKPKFAESQPAPLAANAQPDAGDAAGDDGGGAAGNDIKMGN